MYPAETSRYHATDPSYFPEQGHRIPKHLTRVFAYDEYSSDEKALPPELGA
jgi:hypothetical protein